GEVAGANLFLFDRSCGYYMFGANDPEYRKTGAGTLLLAHSIRHCMERGLESVDVVGINSPNRGDFKTSFNAAPSAYHVVTREAPEGPRFPRAAARKNSPLHLAAQAVSWQGLWNVGPRSNSLFPCQAGVWRCSPRCP